MASDKPYHSPFDDPFGHVADSPNFEFFETAHVSFDVSKIIPGMTKFMVMEVVAFIAIVVLFLPLARRVATGKPLKGKLWNMLEGLLTFIRDEVAKPAIGEHDYKRFLPFLWTLFLFILVLNLLGMLPFLASATGSLMVTGPLALVSFMVIHYQGIKTNGASGYIKSFIPHIEMNDAILKILGPIIVVSMFFLEILGAFIRGIVLAVRLFGNMFAGHTALFMILAFIVHLGQLSDFEGSATAGTLLWPVAGMSVLLVTALSVLELFVACLQAFVFTYLTAVFIGLAMHPEH